MASKTYEYTLEMTCEGCSNAAKRVLGKLGDAVQDLNIDLENKKVFVTTTLSSEEILEALKKTGKAASFVGEKS